MAFKRKRNGRGAGRPAKRRRIMRRIRGALKRVHSFSRTVQFTDLAYLDQTDREYSFQFKLNDLNNYTEFTNLYEMYRICAIKIRLIPSNNVSDITSTQAIPQLMWVRDMDDATLPASRAELMEYPGVRITRLTGPRTIYIKHPRVARAIYNGLTTAYGEGRPNTWVDSENEDVPHYGLKAILMNTSGVDQSANWTCQMYVTLYCQFKNPK